MTDEPFCPIVDTFRSIIYAISYLNGDDPDVAVARHRDWAIQNKAHEWAAGKGEHSQSGVRHEERDNRRAGDNAGDAGRVRGPV